MEGIKLDQGKPRMDLLPMDSLVEVARVLSFGANKYAPRNWELGMDWGRLQGALLRHLAAWDQGQNLDPETGLPHLAHMACNALMLLALAQRGVGKDTRFKPD